GNAATVNRGDRLHSAERIGPRPFVNMDDTAIVAAGYQCDGGERTNDPLLRAAQTLEMAAASIRHSPGLRLRYKIVLRTSGECGHLIGCLRGNSKTRIAALDEPGPHHLTYSSDQFSTLDVVTPRQLNRGCAILAGVRDPGIEEQLVAANDRSVGDR